MRANKCILLLVPIDEIRMYIVTVLITVHFGQNHPAMIVAQHVRVPVLGQVALQTRHIERAVGRSRTYLRVLLHEAGAAALAHIVHQLGHGERGPVAVQRVIVGEAARGTRRRVQVRLVRPAVAGYVARGGSRAADVRVAGGRRLGGIGDGTLVGRRRALPVWNWKRAGFRDRSTSIAFKDSMRTNLHPSGLGTGTIYKNQPRSPFANETKKNA